MANKGDILIFADGQECMVVNNKLSNGGWTAEGNYKTFDDSRTILVNVLTGDVVLHYRNSVPYENGKPYIPLWGGVIEIKRRGKNACSNGSSTTI